MPTKCNWYWTFIKVGVLTLKFKLTLFGTNLIIILELVLIHRGLVSVRGLDLSWGVSHGDKKVTSHTNP